MSLPNVGTAPTRVAAGFCLHDDTHYLDLVLAALRNLPPELPQIPTFAFVSQKPWNATAADWEATADLARSLGMEVVTGEWTQEHRQRRAALDHLLQRGFTHSLIPDGDEIPEPDLLRALLSVAHAQIAERVHVHWDTYWKSPQYVVRPREPFTPCYLVDLRVAKPVGLRNFEGGRPLVLGPEHGIVHHLSWVGPERRVRRKLETWGHAKEVLPGWRQRVWRGWDDNRRLTHLHPTHPQAYGFAEKTHLPQILEPAWERFQALAGEPERHLLPRPPLTPPSPWPTVSVVVPVHGGEDDLRVCLASLQNCADLLHEVILVDDASPEPQAIAHVADDFPFATLIRHEQNAGFAATCNAGAQAATGELLLLLNSDTAVPRDGLVRLVEALLARGPLCAAAGPFTNRSGHLQQIPVTYTNLGTMDLFAQDFAHQDERDAPDLDVDMLVGFCLLVKADALRSIGGLDTRFGRGLFEDNDLCYRLRREGLRLTLAGRAFVHHEGSKTLARAVSDPRALLALNQRLYLDKWREDLASGFASHLSGLPPAHPGDNIHHPGAVAHRRILFDPARKPEDRIARARQRARRADISLVMIVKNEERVLADCLASAMPFFNETILVDTGSTDRTVEIAQAAGARVFHFPWTDSFSQARNESLRHATGRWVFWLDADDTLTPEAGEAIQSAALNAPDEVCAFVVPVQFVDEGGMPGGTRVDHVKLLRNHPDLAFEGRIHEQILPSLRQVFGPEAPVVRAAPEALVLHSGYDTSPQGQARKRERDMKLLMLDLQERPGHPFVLFNLGMTEHYGGMHAEAVDWLRQCLAASGDGESHVRKAYSLLAVSQREMGDLDAALETLARGLAAVGDDPELHFQSGYTHTLRERWEPARRHYEAAVAGDVSGHFSSVDTGILGYKAFHNLGQVCLQTGDWPAARLWWEKALEGAPDFTPSLFCLFDASLERGDLDLGHACVQRLHLREGPSENWARMVERHAEAAGAADQALKDALGRHPESLGVKMVAARRLLNTGREVEAQGLLRELADAGVSEACYFLGVMGSRRGDFAQALEWMERALSLAPEHAQTAEQVANLRRIVRGDNAGESENTGESDNAGGSANPAGEVE